VIQLYTERSLSKRYKINDDVTIQRSSYCIYIVFALPCGESICDSA